MRHAPTLDFGFGPEMHSFIVLFGGLILSVIGALLIYMFDRSITDKIEAFKIALYGAMPLVGWFLGLIVFSRGIECVIDLIRKKETL